MRATGIVRRVDELGRIVIPVELRKTMGISTDTPLEIFTEDGRIILARYVPGCAFCNSTNLAVSHKNVDICRSCAIDISHKVGGGLHAQDQ